MKNHNDISLSALLLLFILAGLNHLNLDNFIYTSSSHNQEELREVNLDDYEKFKESIMPLIDQMGDKKIVALGEGTHGTHEFNKLRFWISRILVEEKGFTHILFENDFSDSYLLNEGLKENQNLETLMRKYLIRIWQTKEVKELLSWIQGYSNNRKSKLQFGGIDFNFVSNDAAIIKDILLPLQQPKLDELATQLNLHAQFQDSIRRVQNDTTFQIDMKTLIQNGVNGYQTAEKIELQLEKLNLSENLKGQLSTFILDSKIGFNPFYQWATSNTESSRDSSMAEIANWIAKKPSDKIIIWAHNGHIAKSSIFGGIVGGMGGKLEEKMPGETFILGFGTSRGTHSAIEDRYIHQNNTLGIYPLEEPMIDSWEGRFDQINLPAFYASTRMLNKKDEILPHRVIGYNPGSGENSYDPTNLLDLYDAFLFIRTTTAAHYLK